MILNLKVPDSSKGQSADGAGSSSDLAVIAGAVSVRALEYFQPISLVTCGTIIDSSVLIDRTNPAS